MSEKQNVEYLCSYKSKSYASVVLNDSEVTFLKEEEDALFRPFLDCVLFMHEVA